MSRLTSLLACWGSEKHLGQLVMTDESLIDHFFRFLEETYGCGHLAAHVAHGCVMAFDEHVVSRVLPLHSGTWRLLALWCKMPLANNHLCASSLVALSY